MKTYNLFPELKRILEDKRIRQLGFPKEHNENYLKAEQFVLDLRGLTENDLHEINETYNLLKEIELDKMPYNMTVVHVLADMKYTDESEGIISYFFINSNEKNSEERIHVLFEDEYSLKRAFVEHHNNKERIENLEGYMWTIKIRLITLLATKNIIKERHEARKPVNRLTGKSHKRGSGGYTIIRIPTSQEVGEEGSGNSKRPHLRRGHIRRLHPHDKSKWIWIAPCFVNGIPEIPRTSYLIDEDAA